MELQDKVVVITGGSGGIGRAMAQAFLREGARGISLADLDETTTKQVALELDPSGERCVGMQCDVTSESDIEALADATKEKFGPIDFSPALEWLFIHIGKPVSFHQHTPSRYNDLMMYTIECEENQNCAPCGGKILGFLLVQP